MEKELLYKSRSFSSCIQVAYRLMNDNFSKILRSTWLPVLILSLMSSLFVTINLPSPQILTLGIAHQGTFLTVFALSFLGILLCTLWLASRLMSMLNEKPRRWTFLRMLMLALNIIALEIVFYGIFFLAIWIALRHTGGELMHFLLDNWLPLLGLAIVFMLVILPFYYIGMRYICDEKSHFWRDLPQTYMTGLRHLGFIFLTTILVSIILFILLTFICLPLHILYGANAVSLLGEMSGDASGLPSYFIPLLSITTFFMAILASYVCLYPWVVYFFMYGSIEKQKEERQTTTMAPIDLPDPQLV